MSKSVRILVVDRSRFSRDTLAGVLRKELGNVEVLTCDSAAEVLERLAAGSRIDLITTALALADMDGVELVEELRRMGRNNDIPVVVVSADADARFGNDGTVPGVSDYFDKAHGYRGLVDFIRDFTGRNFVDGRILLVEDDMIAGKVTHQLLEKEGFSVLHTTSAEQAEMLLENLAGDSGNGNGTFFDLVVSDFFLEDQRTAANLLHLIRVKLRYSPQELPVLVITGHDEGHRQVEVFRAGANDFVSKPFQPEVLITRVRSLLLVKKQFNFMQEQAEELRRLAVTDPLTVVHNRRYLSEYGTRFLADSANAPVGVLIIDIDRLTAINQDQGLLVGDEVLKGVGELLSRELEECGAVVARFAGEEFCALLPRCDAGELAATALELLAVVARERPADLDVGVSIGAASAIDFPDADLNHLMTRADEALTAAKAAGRKRVYIHTGTRTQALGS